jgi:hypothetical protein
MKLIMENWKNFLEEDCQDGYERVPGSKEFAQGSCRKKTNEAEDTRDTYGSEVEDRNRRSRKRGAAKLVGEEKKTKEEKEKEEYKAHMMYDPETGDSEMTKTYERHKELGKKGWGHDKPKIKEGEKEGVKKDACYHKVKANSKEWPSAYASGRLVQCRDKGAENWNVDESIQEKKQSSEDAGRLDKWFGRKGEKGSKGGWVDCNAPDGKGGYKECAQGDRKKKPYCRPTPSACKKEPQRESIAAQLDAGLLASIIREELEALLDEKKKKKACKPSKGKRFAKRVDGKCRSYGQKGQAKGGGDRIRPGTSKGDAYCARSAKIKKCKEPPCANDLSRKKWKCRGDKSVA